MSKCIFVHPQTRKFSLPHGWKVLPKCLHPPKIDPLTSLASAINRVALKLSSAVIAVEPVEKQQQRNYVERGRRKELQWSKERAKQKKKHISFSSSLLLPHTGELIPEFNLHKHPIAHPARPAASPSPARSTGKKEGRSDTAKNKPKFAHFRPREGDLACITVELILLGGREPLYSNPPEFLSVPGRTSLATHRGHSRGPNQTPSKEGSSSFAPNRTIDEQLNQPLSECWSR